MISHYYMDFSSYDQRLRNINNKVSVNNNIMTIL